MKILRWTLVVFAFIALLMIIYAAYIGVFTPLKIYEAKKGPYVIAYERFTGPYAKTGPVFERVYKAVKAKGIDTTRGLGIYYDDPAKVPAKKLRSDCGVVIEEKDLPRFRKVKSQFKVKWIPKKDSVVIEFPIKNKFSYMIGPMKAYPALTKYAKKKGYKWGMTYELYDEAKQKIYFVMVIAK